MNDNGSNKKENFFKREGFYVILFVCLCVVATVAAVTLRTNKISKKDQTKNKPQAVVTENKDSKDVAKSQNKSEAKSKEEYRVEYENALQVKNKPNVEIPKSQDVAAQSKNTTVNNEQNKTSAVAKTSDTTYVKPVDGKIITLHDAVLRGKTANDKDTLKNHDGIDIEVSKGTPVKPAKDGVVETVEPDHFSEGYAVTINHQNGIKTVYGSLMKDSIKVKVGDKVTTSKQIGNVAEVDSRSKDYYGMTDHLHFEVIKDGAQIDPQTYVKGYEVKTAATNKTNNK